MTLTDFLLARIAEDEAWSRECEQDPDRQRAECEAKRRIVADDSLRSFLAPDRLSVMGVRILGYLALPYLDHPDYREEWKP